MFLLGRTHPSPGTRAHQLAHALRWPLGFARVLWNRLPGGPPVHRTETPGDRVDLPAPVPPAHLDDLVQLVSDGVGALLHRRYAVVVDGARTGAEALMTRFADDPNCAVPEVAVFEQTRGGPGRVAAGDEFAIRMPGPWDGPVRVIHMTPTSFRLATLWGHLEAGQIEFRASTRDGALTVEIESWARPGDTVSHLLYNRLLLAKEIQLTLWVQTLGRLADLAEGRVRDAVQVDTRVVGTEHLTELPTGV